MAAPVTGTKLLLLYWGAKADLQAVRKGHDFVICRANRLNSAALRLCGSAALRLCAPVPEIASLAACGISPFSRDKR